MDLNKFFEQRIQRTQMMVLFTTKKILQKEFKKMKRDLIKQLRGNLKLVVL